VTGLGEFDPVIHAHNRLRICAQLSAADWIEFSDVRDALRITDPTLSKHVTVLVGAGYVVQRRATRDKRQRVWLRLTPRGEAAYSGHLAALREIVGRDAL
jgi:DNA-binding MarR family transcriptional regulator